VFAVVVAALVLPDVKFHHSAAECARQPPQPESVHLVLASCPNLTHASPVHRRQSSQSKLSSSALLVHPRRISCYTAVDLLVSTQSYRERFCGFEVSVVFLMKRWLVESKHVQVTGASMNLYRVEGKVHDGGLVMISYERERRKKGRKNDSK
jgi:hypothetical protein